MMNLEEAIEVATDMEYRPRKDIENAIKTVEAIKHNEYRLALEFKLLCLEMDEEVKLTKKEAEGS
jgi:hypothetical protein